ncbi:MAG: AI-2E family transporter [Gemmatimonadales bacterium]
MVGSGESVRVVLVLLLGIVVHLFEANFVVPRIMERQIALPPVLTISSVLIMATLLGPVGLVVAVPILALTLVVVRHVVQGEIYGDPAAPRPAVLRSTAEHRVPRPTPAHP